MIGVRHFIARGQLGSVTTLMRMNDWGQSLDRMCIIGISHFIAHAQLESVTSLHVHDWGQSRHCLCIIGISHFIAHAQLGLVTSLQMLKYENFVSFFFAAVTFSQPHRRVVLHV